MSVKQSRQNVYLHVLAVVETWQKSDLGEQRYSESSYIWIPVHRCRSSERSGRGHRRRRVPELRRGLALIHRDNVKFQKRAFDVDVTTFEYLYGYATTSSGPFVLLAVDRPGSQPVTATLYDDLSAVFERLATYSCPVVICGDFNVHIHQIDDPNAVRLHQLL